MTITNFGRQHKQNSDKATKFAQVVDGCSGEAAIAEQWRQHFNQ